MNGRVCGALVQFGCYQCNTDISECVQALSHLEVRWWTIMVTVAIFCWIPCPMRSLLFGNPQALSSTLTALGMLKPRAFRSLRSGFYIKSFSLLNHIRVVKHQACTILSTNYCECKCKHLLLLLGSWRTSNLDSLDLQCNERLICIKYKLLCSFWLPCCRVSSQSWVCTWTPQVFWRPYIPVYVGVVMIF